MTKCYPGRERRDGDVRKEPAGKETDPPCDEEANFCGEDSRRTSKVGVVKLRELKARKVLIGNRVADLIVDDAVQAREFESTTIIAGLLPWLL